MNMRKIFLILLAWAPVLGYAYDYFEVDGLFYEITGIDEVRLTCETVNIGGRRIQKKIDYEGDLTIPSEVTYSGISYRVTSIDGRVFSRTDADFIACKLTSVKIPNSVTSIGDGAFYHCVSITSVEIPNSVTSIGDNAFIGCTGVNTIYWDSELSPVIIIQNCRKALKNVVLH